MRRDVADDHRLGQRPGVGEVGGALVLAAGEDDVDELRVVIAIRQSFFGIVAVVFASGSTNGCALPCGSTSMPSVPTMTLPCCGQAGADRLADGVGRQLAAVVPPHVDRAAGGELGPGIGQLDPAFVAQLSAVGAGPYDVTETGDVNFSARYGGL